MDKAPEEVIRLFSFLQGGHESLDSYSSITDFKQDLDEEALAHEKFEIGWVLYEEILDQHKITALLKHFASPRSNQIHTLMQFWGVVKVEGSHHHLSSLHQPFYVNMLHKGLCRYRKLCRDHEYVVDTIGEDDKQLGSVERVYRNKLPESTPDLRLYSTHEFPMRDEAARCDFRAYTAIPVFDAHTYQCYCVLEIFQIYYLNNTRDILLSVLDRSLQIAGLTSNHKSIAIKEMLQQPESEIAEVLELAMAIIPRLYLAQVWIPCNNQCVNITTNLCCMEMISFIDCQSKIFNSWGDIDADMQAYLQACEFHRLQIDHSSNSNLCDLTISKNPLAHYTQRARMSQFIAVSHQSNSNHLYVIQFFFRSKFTHDAYGDHSLHLLLKILEINLKSVSVMFVSGKHLLEEYLRLDAIECKSIDSFSMKKSYKPNFLELNMKTYLKTIDSCCLKPYSTGVDRGWVFRLPAGQSVCEKHIKSNSSLIKKKMECFMKKVAVKSWKHNKWIVQFWAPKMGQNRCYLETLDQPYAVGCLAKGIASFRKQCLTHHYFVDDQAKQDELGPPGRVFRFQHPEISPDLIYYTRQEFPVRNFAMLSCNRGYLALPVFDDEGIDNQKLVGVLEFLGFYYSDLRNIGKLLEAAKLGSTHIDFHPSFLANEPVNIVNCRKKALTQIRNALKLIDKIPQLHMANVWVPNGECVSTTKSNRSCMELTLSTNCNLEFMPTDSVHRIHVEARKGIVGMVLTSENKSCFFPNVSEFSIVDHPQSHYDMSDRRDACFAICLHSSHTGNLVYVMEFFLYQGPTTHKYVGSFLKLLLPMIKYGLRSFKLACGKQIGEELVVEVVEFSDANKLDPFEFEHAYEYPITLKSVQYNQKECHHTEEQQRKDYHHTEAEQHVEEQLGEELVDQVVEFFDANKLDSSEFEPVYEYPVTLKSVQYNQKEYHHTEADQLVEECTAEQQKECHQYTVEQNTEECIPAASDSNTRAIEKRKNSLSLSVEVLEPHFGKKLKDVAEELGVGRSTVKRACREHGIWRWPNRKEHKKNPSLFEEENVADSEQDMLPSTDSLHPLDNVTQMNTTSANKVIVKVKYNEDFIKFEFSLSLLGLARLTEEVAMRLNLEMGSFKLKYMDEDGDEISLTRDVDLQLCPKTRTARGEALIQLLVR